MPEELRDLLVRARRREPVLPRGARRRARRQRRARPVGGRMGGRTPRPRLCDARHRPRGARGADRPSSRDREGCAPGGCRDGARLLDGCGRASARRRRARLRRARGARPRRRRALRRCRARTASSRSSTRSRARSHTARSRRLVVDGCTPRSRTGSPRSGSDERAPVLAYHYAEAAKEEDADLVWADDARRARPRPRVCRALAVARRQARARAPRARRGGRALRPRDRAVDGRP